MPSANIPALPAENCLAGLLGASLSVLPDPPAAMWIVTAAMGAATGRRPGAATGRRPGAATGRRATTTHGALNPAEHIVRASPDARVLFFCATRSPRGRTVDGPGAAGLAHQGTATVALAGINDIPVFTSLCADHGISNITTRIIGFGLDAIATSDCIDLPLLQPVRNLASSVRTET